MHCENSLQGSFAHSIGGRPSILGISCCGPIRKAPGAHWQVGPFRQGGEYRPSWVSPANYWLSTVVGSLPNSMGLDHALSSHWLVGTLLPSNCLAHHLFARVYLSHGPMCRHSHTLNWAASEARAAPLR